MELIQKSKKGLVCGGLQSVAQSITTYNRQDLTITGILDISNNMLRGGEGTILIVTIAYFLTRRLMLL